MLPPMKAIKTISTVTTPAAARATNSRWPWAIPPRSPIPGNASEGMVSLGRNGRPQCEQALSAIGTSAPQPRQGHPLGSAPATGGALDTGASRVGASRIGSRASTGETGEAGEAGAGAAAGTAGGAAAETG